MGEKSVGKTDEKPKAVVEMEENSDKGKAKKRQEEKQNLSIKEANKKFLIKFAVFVGIIILVTVLAIFFTIKNLNVEEKKEESTTIQKNVEKPASEDSKFAINSYSETYDQNSIVVKYYEIDGNKETTRGSAEYVQIEGLLNKDIQNNVNERLKQTALDLKQTSRHVYSFVTANFGDILSVNMVNSNNKYKSLNIDLETGEDIPFEDVFVSSAPLNSLIMEGVFKQLAWDSLIVDYDELEGFLDLSKVDTSQYEDIALKVVNNYKSKKDSIDYYISPTGVHVSGLLEASMIKDKETVPNITIDFIEHKEEIAIYKRFLSSKSLYESDSVGEKGMIVFTEDLSYDPYYKNLIYGKVDDNVFMEEVFLTNEDEENTVKEKIRKYINDLAEIEKKNIVSQTPENVGVFYQKEYALINQKTYYKIITTSAKTSCDISYYNDSGFKDFIKMKRDFAHVDLSLTRFSEAIKESFPDLTIEDEKPTELFFDQNGNFLGNNEAEATSKMSLKDEKLDRYKVEQ